MPDDNTAKFSWLEFAGMLMMCVLTRVPAPEVAAVAAWCVLLYWPGQIVLRACGLERPWTQPRRMLLTIATSLAVAPVLVNPIWHVTNHGPTLLGAWAVLLALGYLGAWRLSRFMAGGSSIQPTFDYFSSRMVFALIVLLITFATVISYWPAGMDGPIPSQIHDFIKHHGVLFSLKQRPLPLGDPFFAQTAAGPAYYYHFFYLIPATVRTMAPGISIQLAFGVQAALVGVATTAMFYLLVKRLTGSDGPALLAALLATAIGGLDIIPILILRTPVIQLDGWADTLVRIHTLLNQMVWTPQNVQGLLIALVGIYVLSIKRWWGGWLVLGPVLGASLVGTSVWVAAAFLPGLALWVISEAIEHRVAPATVRRWLTGSVIVAVLMVVLSSPSLWGYAQMSDRLGKGVTLVWDEHQWNALLGRLVPPGILANVLDLPWLLVVEFGALILFPLLIPRELWRRAWRDSGTRLLLLSAAVALVGFVTARSHFRYNDFGMKIIFAAQAAGVVMGACIISPHPGRRRWFNPAGWTLHPRADGKPRRVLAAFVLVVVFLSLPVAFYQTPIVALRRFIPPGSRLAKAATPQTLLAHREAAALNFMRDKLPADAVLQPDWNMERLEIAQMTNKQLGAMVVERDTMVFQSADTGRRMHAIDDLAAVLESPGDPRVLHDVLKRYGVTHVFVGEIEHKRWGGWQGLLDERYFKTLFEHDGLLVIAVQ